AIVLIVALPEVYAVKAATSQVCSVAVDLQGDDDLGRRIAVALKERIQSSPLYHLGDTANSLFLVRIISVPMKTLEGDQFGSAFVVAYLYVADSCTRGIRGKQTEYRARD